MNPLKTFAVVLAVSLFGCRTQIHHGLEERDANELITALVSRGFDATKVQEKGKKPTWAIELDDAHATDALRVLTEFKLPRPPRTTTRELVGQVGLVETPGAERLRQLEALEGDVEQMLESMDGVTSAAVELVVPAPPRPGQNALPSKASALVRVQPAAMEKLQLQKEPIRALIAAAVEGLRPDDVSVMVDPVTSLVSVPREPEAAPTALRVLVLVLAGGLAVLAGAFVLLARKMRKKKKGAPVPAAPAPATAAPTAPPRPVISANVARKAA